MKGLLIFLFYLINLLISSKPPTAAELFPASVKFDYGDQGRNWPGVCNKGLQSPIDIPYSHVMKTVDLDPRSSLRFD
jgi:hypothetical protein